MPYYEPQNFKVQPSVLSHTEKVLILKLLISSSELILEREIEILSQTSLFFYQFHQNPTRA